MNETATKRRALLLATCCAVLAACGGGGASGPEPTPVATQAVPPGPEPLPAPEPAASDDDTLRALAIAAGVTGDPALNRSLPTPDDPVVVLGRALFFSKALGGDLDSACVSCHHPALGGGDGLSLPVGVGAVDPDQLGPGREKATGVVDVPRNAPTVFNAGLWDRALFWDGRVEAPGAVPAANGAGGGIRTPDVAFGQIDAQAGAHLPAAQARFPVTSVSEMRSADFEPGADNEAVRARLAARVGGYGVGAGELARNDWLPLFRAAFDASGSAEALVTFDNIAFALGEYERSLVLVDNPFFAYVRGDDDALTDLEKEGLRLFYTAAEDDGGNCSVCHAGDLFSDEDFHTVAFPQIGPGTGDPLGGDAGRERETGDATDRFRFRTPSLLNVAVTGPFGHAGSYETLGRVLRHYDDPRGSVADFFDDGGVCTLAQFEDRADCASLWPDSEAATERALEKLGRERDDGTSDFPNLILNGADRDALEAFLGALTDPCVRDRACLAVFVADASEDADDLRVVAVDAAGEPL